jgi:hypothetical protein
MKYSKGEIIIYATQLTSFLGCQLSYNYVNHNHYITNAIDAIMVALMFASLLGQIICSALMMSNVRKTSFYILLLEIIYSIVLLAFNDYIGFMMIVFCLYGIIFFLIQIKDYVKLFFKK